MAITDRGKTIFVQFLIFIALNESVVNGLLDMFKCSKERTTLEKEQEVVDAYLLETRGAVRVTMNQFRIFEKLYESHEETIRRKQTELTRIELNPELWQLETSVEIEFEKIKERLDLVYDPKYQSEKAAVMIAVLTTKFLAYYYGSQYLRTVWATSENQLKPTAGDSKNKTIVAVYLFKFANRIPTESCIQLLLRLMRNEGDTIGDLKESIKEIGTWLKNMDDAMNLTENIETLRGRLYNPSNSPKEIHINLMVLETLNHRFASILYKYNVFEIRGKLFSKPMVETYDEIFRGAGVFAEAISSKSPNRMLITTILQTNEMFLATTFGYYGTKSPEVLDHVNRKACRTLIPDMIMLPNRNRFNVPKLIVRESENPASCNSLASLYDFIGAKASTMEHLLETLTSEKKE